MSGSWAAGSLNILKSSLAFAKSCLKLPQHAFLCNICSLGHNFPVAGFNIVSPLSFLAWKKYRSQQLALIEKQTTTKNNFLESWGPIFKNKDSAFTVQALQFWGCSLLEAELETWWWKEAALPPQPGPRNDGPSPDPRSLKAAVSKGWGRRRDGVDC